MGGTRAVRIARGGGRPTASVAFVPNRAGEKRAIRLFAMYAIALVAIYLLFLALALTSPSPGPRSDTTAWGALSLLAAVLSVGGWVITLGRAPRGAARVGELLAVRDRTGRVRRFPAGAESHPRVVHHYPAGLFGPEPTEMIELVALDRSRRTYLVGEGYFDRVLTGVA